MTSTLLVLLLLVQAEEPDNLPDEALEPPLSASSAGADGREDWDSLSDWGQLVRDLKPRFQAAGPDGVPLAEAPFPDGFSVYGEAVVGWDAVRYGGLQRHLQLSLGAEAFTWGRFDVDGRVAVQLFNRNLEVAVEGLAVGMGVDNAC